MVTYCYIFSVVLYSVFAVYCSMSVWRDWFDSSPRGRSSLWVEGSIPSSLTERGAHT